MVHLESSDAVTASVIEQSRSNNLLESCPLSHRNTGLGGYNCPLEAGRYLGTELKLERV